MRVRISIVYSWFVKTITYFFPNFPILMRFRGFLYSLMMEKCGANLQVASSATLGSLVGLKFGRDVYIGPNTVILGLNIAIDDEVLIGPNCVIAAGNHTKINGSFRFGSYQRGGIVIGKGAWIAANCSVLAGSRLPEGSLLAAGSVLNKVFTDAHYIYAGSPAKPIKPIP